MDTLNALNASLTTCAFVRSWLVWVELADRDDARVHEAVVEAVGLTYGPFEAVAFESAPGTQFFRPKAGSRLGPRAETVEMPVRMLTFTVPDDPVTLARAVEAVRYAHSYEEPVILLQQVLASRADDSEDRQNPNRWWNRGFDV